MSTKRKLHGISVVLGFLMGSVFSVHAHAAPDEMDLLRQAQAENMDGKLEDALQSASKAIELAPNSIRGYALRAGILSRLERFEDAISDYNLALKLDPDQGDLYDLRGAERFKVGQIEGSIEDFDRAIKLHPEREREHWMRGISYYYVERFDEGIAQFEGYQTFDSNDVENAVWRYLCMARKDGVDAARDGILKIKDDKRVPMRQIHDLYRGAATPEDVLAAVRADDPNEDQLNSRMFYAQLYLGLYYEVQGDSIKALEALEEAESHKIGHYMWHVAHVHAERLRRSRGDAP